MEFVYVKESAYPLVYKRTGKDETIYIVLNPSGQDVECDAQIPQHAQSVYSNNGEAAYADGKWKVPAASATFLKSRKLKKPAKEEARLPAFAGFIML